MRPASLALRLGLPSIAQSAKPVQAPATAASAFPLACCRSRSATRDRSSSLYACSALPLQNLLEHRAAIWARAIAEYKNGGQWWSNKEESEEIKAQNADFQTIDPWADVICMFLACCPNAYCTISEAFERLEVPIERRNNANTLRLRQIIEQQGWAYGQRRIGGNVHRGFWKPSKPPSEDKDLF
jgi:predicted P-loop ATPase